MEKKVIGSLRFHQRQRQKIQRKSSSFLKPFNAKCEAVRRLRLRLMRCSTAFIMDGKTFRMFDSGTIQPDALLISLKSYSSVQQPGYPSELKKQMSFEEVPTSARPNILCQKLSENLEKGDILLSQTNSLECSVQQHGRLILKIFGKKSI